jgi:hypothetical protein
MRENMVRTQVYLPRDIYKKLQARAEKQGLTLAVQVRAALEDYLERTDANEQPILRADDPLFQMVGMFSSKEGDLSLNHDHYLYGAPKREEVEAPLPPRARERSTAYTAKRRKPKIKRGRR